MKKALLLISIIFSLQSCTQSSMNEQSIPVVEFPTSLEIYITNEKGEEVYIVAEEAKTTTQRQRGLMYRESMAADKGMIFYFEESGIYPFWMKNTLIPLDMIYINEDKKIVDILQAEPCKKDPCPNYDPSGEAKYVLEVNKGFSEKNFITIGNEVVF